jgi:tetratricopeptide (TPR) repeat protein
VEAAARGSSGSFRIARSTAASRKPGRSSCARSQARRASFRFPCFSRQTPRLNQASGSSSASTAVRHLRSSASQSMGPFALSCSCSAATASSKSRCARGDEAEAAAQYRKALALRDGHLPARLALLRIALKNRSWERVVEDGKAVLKLDPRNASVHLAMGIAWRYLGKADEAAAAYGQAEALSGGKLPEVYLARGLLEMKVRNRCEPAIASFRRYTEEAGATLKADAPVFRLRRECEQLLVAQKQAEEAMRQMQKETERQAAEGGGKPGAPPEKPKEPR